LATLDAELALVADAVRDAVPFFVERVVSQQKSSGSLQLSLVVTQVSAALQATDAEHSR